MTTIQIIASLIFIVSLILIFTERVHRVIVAIGGAVLMVGAGMAYDFFSQDEAVSAIDFDTLGLLFGMMLIVALLQPTGFFEYMAILAGRASKGNPVRLLILLGTVTTVLSMFLDNVTTVVLIAPVTILISEILGMNPIPFLISEALLSNTGGISTLVGDPPNVLIGASVPLTFNDFLVHSLPFIVLVWVAVLLLLLWLFRNDLKPDPKAAERVLSLDPSRALNDKKSVQKILFVLAGAVVLFFIHHIIHLSPAFIALGAAAVALILVQPKDVPETFERVEWSVLIFFASLFVMVGGLEAAGVLELVAEFMVEVGGEASPVAQGIFLIWFVAIMSAIVDNIPITIALIPIIKGLGEAGVEIEPLWWALVFGAGLGGNGTIIGSTANIVVVSLSEKTRTPITAGMWARRGLPVMILSCAIISILYGLFFSSFSG